MGSRRLSYRDHRNTTKHGSSAALAWVVESGATFDPRKTKLIHFTRTPLQIKDAPELVIGTEQKAYTKEVKILGVILD